MLWQHCCKKIPLKTPNCLERWLSHLMPILTEGYRATVLKMRQACMYVYGRASRRKTATWKVIYTVPLRKQAKTKLDDQVCKEQKTAGYTQNSQQRELSVLFGEVGGMESEGRVLLFNLHTSVLEFILQQGGIHVVVTETKRCERIKHNMIIQSLMTTVQKCTKSSSEKKLVGVLTSWSPPIR